MNALRFSPRRFLSLLKKEAIEIFRDRSILFMGLALPLLMLFIYGYGVSMDITGVIDEAKDRGCNAVFFGHTHKPLLETIDGVLALNPGSLTYPRQRGRRPSYAIVNLDQTGHLTAELKHL